MSTMPHAAEVLFVTPSTVGMLTGLRNEFLRRLRVTVARMLDLETEFVVLDNGTQCG